MLNMSLLHIEVYHHQWYGLGLVLLILLTLKCILPTKTMLDILAAVHWLLLWLLPVYMSGTILSHTNHTKIHTEHKWPLISSFVKLWCPRVTKYCLRAVHTAAEKVLKVFQVPLHSFLLKVLDYRVINLFSPGPLSTSMANARIKALEAGAGAKKMISMRHQLISKY